MSFDLGFTISGGEKINSILNQLTLDPATKAQLLGVLGDTVIAQTQLRFVDQVGPDGQSWKPSQRALQQGGQTLLDTGALRGSITKLVSADQVEIGTNLPYANAMQYGLTLTAKGKALVFKVQGKTVFTRHISYPGRPYVGLNDADEEELSETVAAFLAAFVEKVQ